MVLRGAAELALISPPGSSQAVMVTSAQFCQICSVCSLSQRHESKYSPAGSAAGTTTLSTMLTFIIMLASWVPRLQPGVGESRSNWR